MNENIYPIRVAQIIGKMVGGGVESVVMNYYKNIDKNKIQFDFIIDSDSTYIPREEIEKLGGRIIEISPYQNLFQYIKDLKKVLKENKYQIVHSHLNSLSVFPLYCAFCAKVPIRIAHSHSTTNKKEWKKNILKNVLKPFSKFFATHYFACTEHAGIWLFGENVFKKGNIFILNNAIELSKFEYNENIRKEKRNELNISDDTFVIGNIGRLVQQKNHMYLINIFNEVQKKKENSVLLLIGQGPLQNDIEKKIKELNIESKVIFLNQREDVNELYQAMDVFVFPSLYEGLGMVLIEAQTSGLPCISSSEVPRIAKVSDNIDFLDLNDDITCWVEHILKKANEKSRLNYSEEIKNYGFDIKNEVKKLEAKYIGLINV